MCRPEASTAAMTAAWQSVDDIKSHMLYFLENHDEQRIASDFFAGDARKGLAPWLCLALMGSNPIMLYAGQEYGERGMDEEGFSGRDGRTTIFDYWTVDSLYHAFVDKGMLTNEERQLHSDYQAILRLASSEKAVTEGAVGSSKLPLRRCRLRRLHTCPCHGLSAHPSCFVSLCQSVDR